MIPKSSPAAAGAGISSFVRELGLFVLQAAAFLLIAQVILVILHFPYDSDRPPSASEAAAARQFYSTAYDKQGSVAVSPDISPEQEKYAKMALEAALRNHIWEQIADFVRLFHLQDKRLLDIGSGQGYLQDEVADYTGMDIAPTVARYYHKPFVLGSATAMPFDDNTFDGAWSIWVLEHVPNPEAALVEIRRVVKDNGVLFLAPQWDCSPWAAEGYHVRPYRDFGLRGKLIKAAIPVRATLTRVAMPAVRISRGAAWGISNHLTQFRYHRLTPNFQTYWEPDSDAVNSLDFYEMALWFRSRGDECLTCDRGWAGLVQSYNPLVIRIHKHPQA
ncbi:MAG TPA: class I SAM-dependent methyltransferase [Bryobacteraceae bacterium]|jgi:SAM-dependent methyltransferase|nr:class I SAM-dependent methyltransferase [Bryobacteraceae bacterium]